jgi:hypothetical protein
MESSRFLLVFLVLFYGQLALSVEPEENSQSKCGHRCTMKNGHLKNFVRGINAT